MAVLPLTDCFLHVAGYDFTTDTNNAALGVEAAALDATTFGSSGATTLAGGLKSVSLSYSGFWQVDGSSDQAVDNQGFPMLGTSQAYTFGPVETEGSPAYMFEAMKSSYSHGGGVGELMPFSLAASATSGQGVVRGQLAKSRGNVSATGAIGTGLNLGAVSASQYLYATFHVFTPGTTITVVVESDDNSGFTTATTRATIGPLTTSGGTWVTRVAGSITDTWWRFRVTACTGTFSVAGAIGVQ
jgi:hypothetical protein